MLSRVGEPLRVCIDARLEPGEAGGVVQGVAGLAHGLRGLADGAEEYLLLVRPGRGEWLEPYLGENVRLLEAVRSGAPPAPTLRERIGARLRPDDSLPPSKGAAESAGARVVHLPTQQGFRTPVPTLYQPWDLQHVHFPDFFAPDERRERDGLYRALCRQAKVVVTATRWAAEDVIAHLDVPRRKVAVIPPASPLAAYGEPAPADDVRRRYDLPEAFALYPARTWPHKNHETLVDALGELARDGTHVPLVCTGSPTEREPALEERARSCGADVRFLGHVPAADLAALYRLARLLVFPSLFEGWGFPVLEGFGTGLPVVCSGIPQLRELAGDAAATFDPTRPEAIALQLKRVWEDEGLRRELAARGRERAAAYSWERTARLCRAHYRRLGGVTLTEDDRALLSESAA